MDKKTHYYSFHLNCSPSIVDAALETWVQTKSENVSELWRIRRDSRIRALGESNGEVLQKPRGTGTDILLLPPDMPTASDVARLVKPLSIDSIENGDAEGEIMTYIIEWFKTSWGIYEERCRAHINVIRELDQKGLGIDDRAWRTAFNNMVQGAIYIQVAPDPPVSNKPKSKEYLFACFKWRYWVRELGFNKGVHPSLDDIAKMTGYKYSTVAGRHTEWKRCYVDGYCDQSNTIPVDPKPVEVDAEIIDVGLEKIWVKVLV
ncbi:MAG: hypothetical protein J5I90_22000 [Caldilineales bacterium]|nr:hypothetical protein [Caldilineales bacterium]